MKRRDMLVALSIAMAVGSIETIHAQEASVATTDITVGSVALLANKLDEPAAGTVKRALTHRDPIVRAVAARIVGTTNYAPLADLVAQALEREENSDAAVEQARALLLIRGNQAGGSIEPRLSAFPDLAIMHATWMVRVQPESVVDNVSKWAKSLGEKRYK